MSLRKISFQDIEKTVSTTIQLFSANSSSLQNSENTSDTIHPQRRNIKPRPAVRTLRQQPQFVPIAPLHPLKPPLNLMTKRLGITSPTQPNRFQLHQSYQFYQKTNNLSITGEQTINLSKSSLVEGRCQNGSNCYRCLIYTLNDGNFCRITIVFLQLITGTGGFF